MTPRRKRINHIRRTVAAAVASLFLALFAGVAIQMQTGRDPALDASTTQSSSTSSSNDDGGGATTLAPATTSQS